MAERVQKTKQPAKQEETVEELPAPQERRDLTYTDDLLDEIDLLTEDTSVAENYRQLGGE